MNVGNLSAALQTVLADPRVRGVLPDVWVDLHYEAVSSGRPGPLDPLLREVEADPSLALFNEKMVVIPGQAFRATLLGLTIALVRRAQRHSPEDAMAGLERYTNSEELAVNWVVALEGISVSERHQLGPDLALISPAQMPAEQLARFTDSFSFGSLLHSPPGAYIERTLMIKRTHLDQADSKPGPRPSTLNPTDLLLCLGLIGPCAPSVFAQWFAPVGWWPIAGFGTEYPLPRWPTGLNKELTGTDVALALEYRRQFLALSAGHRDRLRIPMERLNMALQRTSNTDKIIDLGIALEALLVSDTGDDRGEPTLKVQVRGAWLIGANHHERGVLADTLRGLYHLRNKAVHSGRLPPNHQAKSIQTWIEDGARIVAQGIIKLLQHGIPSVERWQSIVLGGSTESSHE